MKSIPSASLLASSLCAIALVVGCKRRKAPEPPAPAPVEASAATSAAPAPQPGQPAPPVATTRESNDAAYTQEMTQTLNDFLGDYIKQKKRIPKDVSEMVGLKVITSVPVLPGGKKWVIDQQTGKISAQ